MELRNVFLLIYFTTHKTHYAEFLQNYGKCFETILKGFYMWVLIFVLTKTPVINC